jgi:hypothetical protein
MPRRPCLTCGTPTTGTRCPACVPHRPSANARGYGRAHQRATADAIEAEPWCHTLGGCPWPDSATPANPLTGGHPRMLADLGGDRAAWAAQPRIPQCSRCNSGHAPLVEDP